MELEHSRPFDEQHTESDLVTDLKQIASVALRNEKANLEFAQRLRASQSKSPQYLDEIVKNISTKIASRIDCTKCANCCKALVIAPDYRDVASLAEMTGMTTIEFKKTYMRRDAEGDMIFRQKPCPFLRSNRCSVYSGRPALCRGYPYLDRPAFLANISRTLRNIGVCPIVFNTFEALKKEAHLVS
jgi:uncharacterized protein